MKILKVAPATKIPLQNPQILTYYGPEEAKPGSIVEVPIKNRKTKAVVFDTFSTQELKQKIKKNTFQLKEIDNLITPKPIYDRKFRKLIYWSAKFWWEPIGLFIKLALPGNIYKNEIKSCSMAEEKNQNSISYSHSLLIEDDDDRGLILNRTQKALENGQKNLILVPRLDQLKQELNFYSNHSSGPVEKLDGTLTKKQYFQTWLQVFMPEPVILVGTKKSLFLPWRNLGLTVVKQEESSHYKAWGRHPKYHGKHLAFKVSQLHDSPLLLSSSSPSARAYRSFKKDNLTLLNSQSFNKNLLRTNKLEIIDRTEEESWGEQTEEFPYFSKEILKQIKKTAEKNEKSVILQPRRGTATTVFCQDCGYTYTCSECGISYNYHREEDKLICHYCGKKVNPPTKCQECKSHKIKYGGTGTEKAHQELKNNLPNLNGLRLDSDAATNSSERNKILKKFQEENYDYLIGTQMIASSLLNPFSLSCILNLELFLDRPSYKAHINTLSLVKKIEQKTKDALLIQTYQKEQDFLKMLVQEQYNSFYKEELKRRKKFFYPPFSQIVKLVKSGNYKERALKKAKSQKRKMTRRLNKNSSQQNSKRAVRILGPSPATPPKRKGKYQFQLILKVQRDKLQQRNKLLEIIPSDWEINVEPDNF